MPCRLLEYLIINHVWSVTGRHSDYSHRWRCSQLSSVFPSQSNRPHRSVPKRTSKYAINMIFPHSVALNSKRKNPIASLVSTCCRSAAELLPHRECDEELCNSPMLSWIRSVP